MKGQVPALGRVTKTWEMIRTIKGDIYLAEMPEPCCVIAYLLPSTGCGSVRSTRVSLILPPLALSSVLAFGRHLN